MEVLTLRVEENTLEALEDEYSQEGFGNRTEYIRWIIDHRDVIRENTQENTQSGEDLCDRLDTLEQRVDKLEDEQQSTDPRPRDQHQTEDIVEAFDQEDLVDEADREIVVDGRRDDQDADQLREEMIEVLDDVAIPGRKAAVERTRREAVISAWDRLREEENMKTGELANDIFGQFFDNEYLGYSTSSRYPGYGLWDNCIRDALQELPGVESPGRRGNKWRFRPES